MDRLWVCVRVVCVCVGGVGLLWVVDYVATIVLDLVMPLVEKQK